MLSMLQPFFAPLGAGWLYLRRPDRGAGRDDHVRVRHALGRTVSSTGRARANVDGCLLPADDVGSVPGPRAASRRRSRGSLEHCHDGRTRSCPEQSADVDATVGGHGHHAIRLSRLPGELQNLQKTDTAGSSYTRTLAYDTLGRLVANSEPNVNTWLYAYNDAGRLVGTSDARGCGENIAYDTLGRILSEDYSPCESQHAAYSATPEVSYKYDVPETAVAHPEWYEGSLVAVYDRAEHMQLEVDGRGRVTRMSKQIAAPVGGAYTPHVFQSAIRVRRGQSCVPGHDRRRRSRARTGGRLQRHDGIYDSGRGLLCGNALRKRSASSQSFVRRRRATDGRALRRRVAHRTDVQLLRGWIAPRADHLARRGALGERQRDLFAAGGWRTDHRGCTAGSLVFVRRREQRDDDCRQEHVRMAPSGMAPASRTAWSTTTPTGVTSRHDRLQHTPSHDDAFVHNGRTPRRGIGRHVHVSDDPLKLPNRVRWQTFQYDGLDNLAASNDDQHAMPDRSMGTASYFHESILTNAKAVATPIRKPPPPPPKWVVIDRPNLLVSAWQNNASAQVSYDDAGNTTLVALTQTPPTPQPCDGPCLTNYKYSWDEVGRLQFAERFEGDSGDSLAPVAAYFYLHSSSGERVVKGRAVSETAIAERLRRGDLPLAPSCVTEARRKRGLRTNRELGDRLPARRRGSVVRPRAVRDRPLAGGLGGSVHVFLEFGDHQGSLAVAVDHDSGELVERATYLGYGGAESDLRPDRWGDFREAYRYTGHDDDAKVGLTYFGERYYIPMLGRWASADPLTIHGRAGDVNPYAFVGGSPLMNVDLLGMCESSTTTCDTGSTPSEGWPEDDTANAGVQPSVTPFAVNPNGYIGGAQSQGQASATGRARPHRRCRGGVGRRGRSRQLRRRRWRTLHRWLSRARGGTAGTAWRRFKWLEEPWPSRAWLP